MSALSRRALSLGLALRRRSLKLHTLDSFRFRPFRALWVAVLLTSGGQWLQQVVVGWLAYDVTRSPLLTALAMGVTALPNVVGSPVGGVLSDRYDRTKVLAVVYGCKGIVVAGFAALVVTGRLEAWHIFAFVLAKGFLESISWPTRLSLIPRIVPREYLSNAFALTILTSSAARLAVPAAAGVLIVVLGPGPTLLSGTVMYLGASVTVATIRLARADQARDRGGSVIGELLEAARYVKPESTEGRPWGQPLKKPAGAPLNLG